MSDVKVPGLGNVPKPALYAVGAASAGILAYAWWKHRGSANHSVDNSGGSGSTSTDSSIDPATGVPYSEEYGYGNGAGYSYLGTNDPSTGAIIGSGVGTGTVYTATTNASWAQAAQSYLSSIGYDGTAVSAALGAGLLGHYMTPDQVGIWNAAIAFEGNPPGGYPPLNTTPPHTNPPPGGGTVVLHPATGLKVTSTTKTTVGLSWNRVAGASHYRVYDNVSSYNVGDSTDNQIRIGGLRSNTTYKFHVRPLDSHGAIGPKSATVSAKTKR